MNPGNFIIKAAICIVASIILLGTMWVIPKSTEAIGLEECRRMRERVRDLRQNALNFDNELRELNRRMERGEQMSKTEYKKVVQLADDLLSNFRMAWSNYEDAEEDWNRRCRFWKPFLHKP